MPAPCTQLLNLFALVTGCGGSNYLQDSFCSLAHFRANARTLSHTEQDNARPLSRTEPEAQATETFLWHRHSR